MQTHRLIASALAAGALFLSLSARAQVSLEPDGGRFGTVRADGARVGPSHWWNPYGPNVLKGDVPFAGANNYLVLTGIVDSFYEDRADAKSGQRARQANANTMLFALEYFNGETVFRPKTISLRGTAIARSTQNVASPTGANRVDQFAVGESFAEILLASHGRRFYDSSSVRLGAQAVNVDVQGLVLNDVVAGAREFSEFLANRFDVNLLYERPLRKEGGLVVLDRDRDLALQADVAAANLVIGDAFVRGFNLIVLGAYDDDRRVPSKRLRVGYGGLAANGHIGRFLTAPAVYLAVGDSEHDVFAPTGQGLGSRILAPMAVIDIARPANAWNPRMTLLYAPGDSKPFDGKQSAYDAISDRVAFAGGAGAGVFAGNGIVVKDESGNPVTLFRKGSVLPSLRGLDARPNYVSGGMILADLGTDLAISPRFTAVADVAVFGWDQPRTLATLLFPSGTRTVDRFAASEVIGQLKFKPFLNENALVALTAAALFPAKGLQDLGVGAATQVKGNARVLLAF